jgi:hypothetical protein
MVAAKTMDFIGGTSQQQQRSKIFDPSYFDGSAEAFLPNPPPLHLQFERVWFVHTLWIRPCTHPPDPTTSNANNGPTDHVGKISQ